MPKPAEQPKLVAQPESAPQVDQVDKPRKKKKWGKKESTTQEEQKLVKEENAALASFGKEEKSPRPSPKIPSILEHTEVIKKDAP